MSAWAAIAVIAGVACSPGSERRSAEPPVATPASTPTPTPTTPTPSPTAASATLEPTLCHGVWCWVSGAPDLVDVAALGRETWAVGAWGTVAHHDGTRWGYETLGSAKLTKVWPRAKDDVWVVGEAGFVAHHDGQRWTTMPVPVDDQLVDLDGVAPDDVWFVGGDAVLRWNGKAIERVRGAVNSRATAVLAIARDQVWLSATTGLWKWDGKQSKREDFPVGAGPFIDLRADGPSDVWGLGFGGTPYHWDGQRWTMAMRTGMVPPREARDGESLDQVIASGVNEHGQLSRGDQLWVTGKRLAAWDGTRWHDRGGLPGLYAASARVGDQLVAVGVVGRILRGAPGAWRSERRGFEHHAQRMWSFDDGELVIAGYDNYAGIHGKLTHLRAGAFATTSYDGPADALAGRAADDLYTAGPDGDLRHYDGKVWTKLAGAPAGVGLHAIAIGTPTWVVGERGTILEVRGTRVAPVASPVGADHDVVDVWSASPTRAWAIANHGTTGTVLSWDGTTWTIAAQLPGERLTKLSGIDADHVWLSTSKRLLAWDGKAWSPAAGWPANEPAGAVHALASDDVWVVASWAVAHYDGKGWTREPIATRIATLHARRDAVWLGGADGALLVRKRGP